MKVIIIDGKEHAFLQYDNEDLFGNRILIYFSETATTILELSKTWFIDGPSNTRQR